MRADNAWREGNRREEVAPRGTTTPLALVTWFESMPPGSLNGVVFGIDDVRAAYEELLAKDVEFEVMPEEQPWGMQAVSRHLDGNGFVLAQA